MIVLGFDTSTQATAVAVRLADGQTTEARDDPPPGAHPGHATRLLEMAHQLLASAGVAWREVDRIAVGIGPGTFTGLRVGVASARGLAQSLAVELVAVSSPRALALPALATALADDATGSRAEVAGGEAERGDAVLAVIDARRGEAFVGAYAPGTDGAPLELAEPRALAPAELTRVIAEAEAAGGGVTRRWLAVGDGAIRFRDELESDRIRTPPDASPLHLLSAGAICELAIGAAVLDIEQIRPDYRRRPDAELAFEAAGTTRAPSI
jgi:tRNA threonylcarbamoyladenosine biosynthesis protein TsaB